MKYKLGVITLCWALLSACAPDENLQQRVAVLEAKESIRALFTDYGRTLDNRDYAAFAELFTQDAVYGGGGGQEARGPDNIAAQLEGVISANASGANLHIFANEKIDVDIKAGTASALSRGAFYIEDQNGNPMPLMFATYEDQLALEEGRWKFSSRKVIGDLPGPSNESRAAR